MVYVLTVSPSARYEILMKRMQTYTYANVTLAFERCCVTKIRFIRVCMGTQRFCFKRIKFNVLRIKSTYLVSFLYSLFFGRVSGSFESFSAS